MPDTPAVGKRTRRVEVLVNDEEYELMRAIADRAGLSIADVIRLAIRNVISMSPTAND